MHGVNDFQKRLEKVKLYHSKIWVTIDEEEVEEEMAQTVALNYNDRKIFAASLIGVLSFALTQELYTESHHTSVYILIKAFSN